MMDKIYNIIVLERDDDSVGQFQWGFQVPYPEKDLSRGDVITRGEDVIQSFKILAADPVSAFAIEITNV